MNEMLLAKLAKKVFDLCDAIGDGIHGKLHLIFSTSDDRLPNEETEQRYRGYHAHGYCFTVTKEKIYLAEDEINNSAIDGFEYSFSGDEFEGFKELIAIQAIDLLKEYN